MNPRLFHLLADERHAARHVDRHPCDAVAAGRPVLGAARCRLGMLLVAAGLHLVTSAEPSSRPPALAS